MTGTHQECLNMPTLFAHCSILYVITVSINEMQSMDGGGRPIHHPSSIHSPCFIHGNCSNNYCEKRSWEVAGVGGRSQALFMSVQHSPLILSTPTHFTILIMGVGGHWRRKILVKGEHNCTMNTFFLLVSNIPCAVIF